MTVIYHKYYCHSGMKSKTNTNTEDSIIPAIKPKKRNKRSKEESPETVVAVLGLGSEQLPSTSTLTVTAMDISGIMCYIDNRNLVFKSEDILSGTINPKVVGKLNKDNTITTF